MQTWSTEPVALMDKVLWVKGYFNSQPSINRCKRCDCLRLLSEDDAACDVADGLREPLDCPEYDAQNPFGFFDEAKGLRY